MSNGLLLMTSPLRAAAPGPSGVRPHHICFARRSRSSLGSSPAVASRKVVSASLAAPFRFCGTCTDTVTSRSPVVPSERRAPLPRTRKVRPFGVPAGMRTLTGTPRGEGTLISEPSVASGNVTGTVTVRLSDERPNTGCGATCTRTYRSPFGPPRSPGAPLPLSLIRWPSVTPAGIRVATVRVLGARPLPEHAGHGSSTTSPRPLHSRHGSENAKLPRFLLEAPVPWQVGHTRGTVPDLAPVPRHLGQAASLVSRSETVAPSRASLNDTVVSVSTSAPRRGLGWVPRPPPPPPNTPPNRSFRSNGNPPACPPGPGVRKPPLPNSERASSYSLRRLESDSVLYASEIPLNRSSALGSPLLASGWYLRASFRYDFLILSAVAVLETPRTL